MLYLVDRNPEEDQNIALDRAEIQVRGRQTVTARSCDCGGEAEEVQRGGGERRSGQSGGSATPQERHRS